MNRMQIVQDNVISSTELAKKMIRRGKAGRQGRRVIGLAMIWSFLQMDLDEVGFFSYP
jgi:hypothetical protein